MPFATGAFSSRSRGRRVRIHSLDAACIQNPAAEIAYSRAGDTGSCVIAKKGIGPNDTPFRPRVRIEDERHADVAALVNRQAERGATQKRRDRAG